MSYQTSIHFDPTALLIIKSEVDHSIQQVESAVSTLVEEQILPFGIDDALVQFEQCAQVLELIEMSSLAKIAQYSANLMRKIMQTPPVFVNLSEIDTLSTGINLLKRYIEFICLREVQIPQFLLSTLNQLELALNLPLTQEGQHITELLACIRPNFNLAPAPDLEKSHYVHRLYKTTLQQLLAQKASPLDFQALKIVGAYLASAATHTPSAQYWQLVQVVFNQIGQMSLQEPRLRILIRLERQIAAFAEQPSDFNAELTDLANILSLCISQENEVAQHIREKLNVGDELLTDTQLQLFSRHLYGPDFATIHNVSDLIGHEINQLSNDIEYQHLTMSASKCQELQHTFHYLGNVFNVLNLNQVAATLHQQAAELSLERMQNPDFAEHIITCLQNALNAIGMLERQYISPRLQLEIGNPNISLSYLNEAHQVLIHETKALIELSSQSLVQYLNDGVLDNLQNLPSQLREIGGAIWFLDAPQGQQALLMSAEFIETSLQQQQSMNRHQIDHLLEALASADFLLEHLKNQQPILPAMFDIALRSSSKLKSLTK